MSNKSDNIKTLLEDDKNMLMFQEIIKNTNISPDDPKSLAKMISYIDEERSRLQKLRMVLMDIYMKKDEKTRF